MKLVTFGRAGMERPAFLIDDRLYPVDYVRDHSDSNPWTVNDVIANWDNLGQQLFGRLNAIESIPLLDVRLGPPNPAPRNIIGIGFNYRTHTEQMISELPWPRIPIAFMKPVTSITGSNDPIVKPRETACLDYEIELAVVIGRECHRVTVKDAAKHIFGYAIAIDVTARDICKGESDRHHLFAQTTRGKGSPTFCPLGPWICTRDELPDISVLNLRLLVNGELRQQDRCSSMVAGVDELLASVSASMRLLPGDLLLTGTPGGCAFQMPVPTYLRHGDIVSASIDGLGKTRNVVIAEKLAERSDQTRHTI